MNRNMLISACLHMAVAIALGAFGAHKLKPLLSPEHAESFQTASKYQVYHAIALLIIFSGNFDGIKGLKAIGWLLNVGIVLFSGSIYLLSTREITHITGIGILGPVTPLGGLCFLAGWLWLAIKLFQRNKTA